MLKHPLEADQHDIFEARVLRVEKGEFRMTKNQAKTALSFFILAILFFITSRYIIKFFFLFFLIGLVCLVLGVSILKGRKK